MKGMSSRRRTAGSSSQKRFLRLAALSHMPPFGSSRRLRSAPEYTSCQRRPSDTISTTLRVFSCASAGAPAGGAAITGPSSRQERTVGLRIKVSRPWNSAQIIRALRILAEDKLGQMFCNSNALVGCAVLWACAGQAAGASAPATLAAWLAQQEERSWQHMLENISPREPKRAGEDPPLAGIVVGALQKKDPDYYFHWIRDSSLVMHAAADAFALRRPYASRSLFERQFTDFLTLTQRLQALPSKYGLGEPRYTVTGELDSLPWSRPQFDGPALRVLAVVDFLRAAEAAQLARPDLEALATTVLGADLDFVASVWNQRGFDAWEELVADRYHTRLVQLAALEQGADWLERHGAPAERVAKYRNVAQRLEPLLDDHWDPTRGFLRSQLAIVATDGYTAKKTDLDAEVIVAGGDGG